MRTGVRGVAALVVAMASLVTCGGVEEAERTESAPTGLASDDEAESPAEADDDRGAIVVVLELGSVAMECAPGELCIDDITIAGVEPEKGELRVVAPVSPDNLSWHPVGSSSMDGSLVAVRGQADEGLEVIDLATGDVVWSGLAGTGFELVGWSPDAEHLAVLVVHGGDGSSPQQSIVAVSLGTGEVREMVAPGDWYADEMYVAPSWSADGELFAYGSPVRVVDAETGEAVAVPYAADDSVQGLMWLPDGKHVLVMSADEGFLVQDLEGRTTARIGDAWPLGVSPDGEWILVEEWGAGRSGEAIELTAQPLDGGPAITVWTEELDEDGYGGYESALWSPAGDAIALTDGTSLTIHPLEGGEPEVVVELDREQGYISELLGWIPTGLDGPPVALKDVDGLGPPGELVALDLRTGAERWRVPLGGLPADPYLEGTAIGDDGSVYTLIGRTGGEAVVAVDGDGSMRWTVELPGMSLVRAGDPVIVTTSEGTNVAALDPADGAVRWERDTPVEHLATTDDLVVAASSVPGTLTVLDRRTGEEIEAIRLCGDCLLVDVTADDARIVAVTVETAVAEPPIDTPTTHVVDVGAWTVRAIPDVGSLYAEAVSVVDDAIVVAQQGTEPAGDGASGTLRSVALADGDVRWEREAATADVSVAGDEHVLLLGDTTTALDAATGTELWTADGGYDLATGDDVVVVVSHDGGGTRVHAHDLGDGSLLWEWFVADGPRDVTAGAGIVVVPLHEGDELSVDRAEADEIQPPPVDTAPVEEVPIEEIPAETEAPAETETRVPEPAPVPAGQLTLGDVLDRIEAALDAEPIVLGDGVTLLARVGPCATGTPGSWSDVDEETPAGRGTTVLCASGTEPEGYTETGEMLVVVLDDAGRVATQVATDGSTSNPFVAPPGMLCRDYLATYHSGGGNFDERAAYTELLAYWFLEGEPDRMDVDHDGVPCETLFAAEVVADVWSGSN